MLILQNLTYIHSNKDVLFDNIYLTVNKQQKTALIGNNGVGKSTLLKIMSGILKPSEGTVHSDSHPWYIPQLLGQFNEVTIANALNIEHKLNALKAILSGDASETNFALLDDDWTIEERCQQALAYWQLENIDLAQPMSTLSGGQKTKIFLAGIIIHQPEIVLMDEPSNHLDTNGRQLLYDFIQATSCTLIVISHDRKLLNLLDVVCELGKRGITVYGGNYDFYTAQKMIEDNALNQDVRTKEKALRKAKEAARETAAKQQKLDARGKKKQEKAGVPTIAMKTLKNNAEKSTARVKEVHSEKTGNLAQELHELRKELADMDKMKFGFDNSDLHKGKILIQAKNIHFAYEQHLLWKTPLNFTITSGERIAITGLNGSGKTTLIKIILGDFEPHSGTVDVAAIKSIYIDQDYSLIDNQLTVYDQAQQFNVTALQEHEVKMRLNRFLFTKDYWDKPCRVLSGGEKMRLILSCLTIGNQAPDIIILDEPTNNLDIQNLEILTGAINDYWGTLIVISHDVSFLEQIKVERKIGLDDL